MIADTIAMFEANPEVTVLDTLTVDGKDIVVVLDAMSKSYPRVTAFSVPNPGYLHEEYVATLSQKSGYGSEPGPWGVNLQGSGPYNTVEYARLAAMVISLAANEAARRNIAERKVVPA